MSRIGSLSTVDQSRLTSFGHVLYDYLLSFRPTKTVPEFAREVGVSSQAVWDWLRAGTIPRRDSLVAISERANLPLEELLEAADLPSTQALRRERAAYRAMQRASIQELMNELQGDAQYSDDDRVVIQRYLEAQLDAFPHDTDTYREFAHPSPMAYEAQVAEDQARVYEPAPITTPEEAHGQAPRQRHERIHERMPEPPSEPSPRQPRRRGTNPSGPVSR